MTVWFYQVDQVAAPSVRTYAVRGSTRAMSGIRGCLITAGDAVCVDDIVDQTTPGTLACQENVATPALSGNPVAARPSDRGVAKGVSVTSREVTRIMYPVLHVNGQRHRNDQMPEDHGMGNHETLSADML